MILIYDTFLVTRNARDRVQTAQYMLYRTENSYVIKRFTGQFQCKITEQAEKVIEKGKVKRTLLQQAELEYNSIVKKALDKGYKKLSDLTKVKPENLTKEILNEVVPSLKTDTNGNIKPELAKDYNKCPLSIFDKPLFCSKKLDGVRCLMKYDEELDEVFTVSRGGDDYDIATEHIRSDSQLKELFRENPFLILDGELYIHGWPLQRISGACRLKTWDDKCSNLQYWIYDIVDTENTFSKRLDVLNDLSIKFKDNNKIKFLEHEYKTGWSDVKKLHDKYVSEGYEGLVGRKPDKLYVPGKRSSDWIKVKEYQEDSFRIIGWKPGLRGIEDMVFVLETKSKKQFEAKPTGTREDKQEYINNIKDILGKFGDVKFFGYSEGDKPTQTVFKAVRYDLK